MIKQIRASYFANFKNAQYCALQSDPIPDYLENGDEVYIIDTGKNYFWDASSSSLIEKNAIDQKQDAPATAGTAGQVLGLDSNLDPVWVNQSSGGDTSNCAPIIINAASGDVASFVDGADNRQIRKIVGTIVPQQSGTGDPSPTNVRPISGWTGANIYNEETYDASATPKLTINWQTEAGTIYGGTVTLNEDRSVDVVASYTKITADGVTVKANRGYTLEGMFGAGIVYIDDGKPANANLTIPTNIKCSTLPVITPYLFHGNAEALYVSTVGSLFVVFYIAFEADHPEITTNDQRINFVNNWLQDHPTEIWYELKTSQTYHIPNIGQLYTYLGTNNVWIDTGAITECDYPTDTKLYVDGLTEPDEDMIADGLIASGKYFTVNNQLYLSTAQIAAGAQIIPGSNCTATSITEALNALNT